MYTETGAMLSQHPQSATGHAEPCAGEAPNTRSEQREQRPQADSNPSLRVEEQQQFAALPYHFQVPTAWPVERQRLFIRSTC
jgi:hypothetical protein